MLLRREFRISLTAVALAALAWALPARAQSFDADRMGRYDGPWRVHAGDDPQWAAAEADDSGWKTVHLGAEDSEALGAKPAVAWYRARIDWKNPPASPALLVFVQAEGCAIFVDGRKMSDCNQLPGASSALTRGIYVPLNGVELSAPLVVAVGSMVRGM